MNDILLEFKVLGSVPSVNNLYHGSSYGIIKANLTNLIKNYYGDFELINEPIKLLVTHYLKENEFKQQDVDNKQKLLQDSLCGTVIEDDSLIYSIISEKKLSNVNYFTVLIEKYTPINIVNAGEIIGTIDDKLEILKEDNDNLKDENVTLKSQISNLENQLKQLKSNYNEVKQLKENVVNKCSNQTTELVNLNKKIRIEQAKHKKVVDDLTDEINSLKKQVGKITENNDIIINSISINSRINDITSYFHNLSTQAAYDIFKEVKEQNKVSKKLLKNRISIDNFKTLMRDEFNLEFENNGDYLRIKNKVN